MKHTKCPVSIIRKALPSCRTEMRSGHNRTYTSLGLKLQGLWLIGCCASLLFILKCHLRQNEKSIFLLKGVPTKSFAFWEWNFARDKERATERERKKYNSVPRYFGRQPRENIFLMNSAISLSVLAQYRISSAFVQYRTYREGLMQADGNKDVKALLHKELKGRVRAHRRGHSWKESDCNYKKINKNGVEGNKKNIAS
jgi:hypothetical protein